ncbi:peptidase M23 [Alicyclobacillus contaminans]|nr:peptidase M23 [Alicyclobacillus contaminans]
MMSGLTVSAYADKLSDARKQAQDLANQQKQTKQKIAQLQQQEGSLRAQISQLQTQISNLQSSIADTTTNIAKQQAQINQLQSKIADTQKQLDAQYAVLEQRLRILYEDGNTSYLDVLFSSTSFSDMLDRFQLLAMIAKQDKAVLNGIQDSKRQLDSQNRQLKAVLAELQQQQRALMAKKQQQETAQQQEGALLVKVHDARLSQEAQLQGENAAMQHLQSLIQQLESQEGGYSGPAAGWTWPVPGYTSISSGYGWRTWSDGSREFHNGIDIPAPIGTPIVAATSGKVLLAGPATGFGDWVVIESSGGCWRFTATCTRTRSRSARVRWCTPGSRLPRSARTANPPDRICTSRWPKALTRPVFQSQ